MAPLGSRPPRAEVFSTFEGAAWPPLFISANPMRERKRITYHSQYTKTYEKVYCLAVSARFMAKESTGKRLLQIGIDADLVERFTDFREAGYLGAPEHTVLSKAMQYFMDHILGRNPDIKNGYDAKRANRRNQIQAE
jgi:hypothetical protein